MAEQGPASAPLTCARCGAALRPGPGDFSRVSIEAVADPTPPAFPVEDLEADVRHEIERLLARVEGVSGQEALDQVYRRRVLHLCGPCCRRCIDDPTG